MPIIIQVHGHIDETATFEALAEVMAAYTGWTVRSSGYVDKVTDARENLNKARNILIDKNMQDEGLEVQFEYDPDGAEKALMEFGRSHEVDITLKRRWGHNGDGYVAFVRAGGDPIRIPIAGGETAVTAKTLKMLQERGMCSIETIHRLLSVLDDAENLPRFTISDDVVRAAVLPKRSLG
ncbi:hypothetical protein G6L37_05790 [Agrobacterium rubi]|nr:hypothetical protein [Agrobacterium rubi]NTF24871.1 hypothetical protein [Agrobacterium rubi]